MKISNLLLANIGLSDAIAVLAVVVAIASAAFTYWNIRLFKKFSYMQNATSVLYNQFAKWKLTFSGRDEGLVFEFKQLENFNKKFSDMTNEDTAAFYHIHKLGDDEIKFYTRTSGFKVYVYDFFQLIKYITETADLGKGDQEYLYRIINSNIQVDAILEYLKNCNKLAFCELDQYGSLKDQFEIQGRNFDDEYSNCVSYLEKIKPFSVFL